MIVNCKKRHFVLRGAEGSRLTQKTAWFMLQRVRLAMQDNRQDWRVRPRPREEPFEGPIEARTERATMKDSRLISAS